jgi:HEAT repeat protein
MLVTAMALQVTGCAKSAAYLSRMTGREADQKLVEVDKSKKKAKPSDKAKGKSTESQLAKKSSKPKVHSSDKSPELAAKETTKPAKKPSSKESNDPFLSEEFEALADARAKAAKNVETAEAQASEFADKAEQEVASAKSKAAATGSKIQEVAHKVEDNLADIGDLPEWALDVEAPVQKAASKTKESVKTISSEVIAEEKQAFSNLTDGIKQRLKDPAPARQSTTEERPASADLASLCPDAQGELRDLLLGLKESDSEGLKRGIHRIGRMGTEAGAAAPALTHLLQHKDGFVRTHAALALARIQASPPEAVQAVVDGLKSTDPGLRSFAAAVLAEMGPQASEALSTLAESLNDRDGYVRLHAAEVLIRYDRWSYQALEALLGGLTDKDENIRWLATYSLAELAPESQETVDALLKSAKDPVMKVRIGAVYALGEIGPFAKSASGELRKLADSTTNQELHSAILYALQQIEQ